MSLFTRAEKLFVFFAILSGFSISFEYGITRPASNALFLTAFSSQFLPWVWLATVPLNLLVVLAYNRILPKIGPLRMFLFVATAAASINILSALLLPHFPSLIFFHYAWKDIYILLMFKQLWSMIHSTITAERAKYLYGLIFGMGTLGAIVGNTIPGFFASKIGSEQLFFFTLPIYLFLMFSYAKAFRFSSLSSTPFQTKESTPQQGFSLLRQNRFLIAVLLVVVLMQASIALMEYQFNAHLELNILEKDLRTEYCGKLIGLMNLFSGALQLVGGFLFVHLFGLRGSHLLVPILLLANASLAWAFPSFAVISFAYVLIKSVDFSLFGVIREMLYIPLHPDEKYRAKAVIDVFAYRTSKALISLVVLSLQFLLGPALLPLLSYSSIVLFIAWILVVLFILRKTMPIPQKAA